MGFSIMLPGSEPKLDDVQYEILKLGLRFARDKFYHVSLNTLSEHVKCSDSIVEAALTLLADREQIKLGQHRDRGRVGVGGAWHYYEKGMNITPFLYKGGNFAYKVTPLGELLDRLSKERGGNDPMSTLNLRELQIAILKELAETPSRPKYKFNLLGRPGMGRGPLENRLGITFTEEQRDLAGQAFNKLKTNGHTRVNYAAPNDTENWVLITEDGLRVLSGNYDALEVARPGTGKFGIPDEASFKERLALVAEAITTISVLFLDLDNFKSVNDNYDHSVGDRVIREAISVIQAAIENKGELFHRSGDEMLVLLPNFNESEACSVGERVRKAIEEHNFSTIDFGNLIWPISAP